MLYSMVNTGRLKMTETKFKSRQGPHQIDGFFFEGIAAHFNFEKMGKEVILICNSKEDMAYFFGRIAVGVLDPRKCMDGFFGPSSKLVSIDAEKAESYPENKHPYYWYIHPESGCCFLEYEDYTGDGLTSQLGLAVKQTVEECKELMRKNKVPRSVIEVVSISTEEPIPF